MSLSKVYNIMINNLIFSIKGGVAFAKRIGVQVGTNCRIYTNRFGNEPYLIEIGNNVTITAGVIFLTHDGSTWLFRDKKGRRFTYKKIKIGDNVFIGVNSIIMPGVVIENNVIIGAGSIVTKSIPNGVIVAGNPARIIGSYEKYQQVVLDEYVNETDFNLTLSKKENIINFSEKSFPKPILKTKGA